MTNESVVENHVRTWGVLFRLTSIHRTKATKLGAWQSIRYARALAPVMGLLTNLECSTGITPVFPNRNRGKLDGEITPDELQNAARILESYVNVISLMPEDGVPETPLDDMSLCTVVPEKSFLRGTANQAAVIFERLSDLIRRANGDAEELAKFLAFPLEEWGDVATFVARVDHATWLYRRPAEFFRLDHGALAPDSVS